jgi:hypothetical protein
MIGSIYQINAPSFCYYISKDYCRKDAWAMQKLFIKKEKKERIEKMDKCPNYKTMGTLMPT